MRESRTHLEQGQDGKVVGGILLPTKNRNPHVRNRRMGQFMEHNEEHVAYHELDGVLALPRRQLLQFGIVLQALRHRGDLRRERQL